MSTTVILGIAAPVATLGGVALGAWLNGRATAAVENARHQRELERERSQARAAARLVLAEMRLVVTSLESAMAQDRWSLDFPLPTEEWDRHGALLARQLPEDLVVELAEVMAIVKHAHTSMGELLQGYWSAPLGSSLSGFIVDLVARAAFTREDLERFVAGTPR